MTNYALLNNVDHQDVRVITTRSEKYGDNVMYAMTFPFEFRNVQAHYPILFHRDDQGDLSPVALFGFRDRENLFLDESGWQAPYIPAMIRREPFLIGYQGQQGRSSADQARVLSIDTDHPRVSRSEGEALFQPLGGRTRFLDDAADLLEAIFEGLKHSKALVKALTTYDLLESVTLDIELVDGSRNQLIGFYCINEENLQQLSGANFELLNKHGLLLPLFMVLASMSNIQALVKLKNERLVA